MSDLYDVALGAYTLPVTTSSAACQTWFDRGMVWAYQLHREEALWCFQRAAEADPACVMAHWGVAFANTPEYNWNESGGFFVVAAQASGFPSFKVADDAINRATSALAPESPPRERALVEALTTLFEWPVTPEAATRKVAYADAMEALANDAAFSSDPDVLALAADAVLSLSPWNLYEADRVTPKAVAVRAKAMLERGLAVAPKHMYLCHLRVHFDEMGPVESFEWASAENLRATDATDAGHLIHMPSHLDIQVGAYAAAMEANKRAVEADLRAVARAPQRCSIYVGYIVHNMEFLAWAAMYAGCQTVALAAADQMAAFLDAARLTSNPMMPNFFEAYLTTRYMVYVRFGMWDAILASPPMDDAVTYLASVIFRHFARGIALGATGDVAGAKAEQAEFRKHVSTLVPDTRRKHNVNLAEHTCPIAECVLDAEILYREGRHDECYEVLETAVSQYDALPYDEPAGYLMSPRQTLGALLTEQGCHARAIPIYDADLKTFPKNPWSLAGLARCLRATGDIARLPAVEAALAAAKEVADVPVCASCACALQDWGEAST